MSGVVLDAEIDRSRRAGPGRGVVVAREQVDDPQSWTDLVALLADLLFPPAPDEPSRR